jgi:hypothetical protein
MGFPVAAFGGLDDPSLDMDYINDNMIFTPSERCTISCGTVCVDPRASKVLIIFNRRLGIWQLPKGRKNIGEDLQSAALRETYEETGVQANLLSLKIRTRSTTPYVDNDCAADAARRSNDAASHRATPSTASASSASTAHSTSIVSMASTTSSIIMPSYTPASPGRTPLGADGDGLPQGNRHKTTEATEVQNLTRTDSTVAVVTMVSEAAAATAAPDPKLTCDTFNNELVGIVQYPDLQAATSNTIKTVFFFAAFADSTAVMGPGAQEEHEDLQARWVDFHVASERLRFGPEKEAMWKVWGDMERSGLKC